MSTLQQRRFIQTKTPAIVKTPRLLEPPDVLAAFKIGLDSTKRFRSPVEGSREGS
jgi:hypothetical protein